MRVSFSGKGGSGKSTLAALFSSFLVNQGLDVFAVDADINQNLARLLAAASQEAGSAVGLGSRNEDLKIHLKGSNSRIRDHRLMLKTTPPGRGSRLLRLEESCSLLSRFWTEHRGVRILRIGGFQKEDLGTHCYHAKTGALELILNHLIDASSQYLISDMTAGADAFASGLFAKFDLSLLIVEPTFESVGVFHQYKSYASEFDIHIRAVANKIVDEEDLNFITREIGESPVAVVPFSKHLRAVSRGGIGCDANEIEEEGKQALRALKAALDECRRDWGKLQSQAIEFHRRNCASWANDLYSQDLTSQIDLEFSLEKAAIEILRGGQVEDL